MTGASFDHQGTIPILLGVTGHRDLRTEDLERLKGALSDRFNKLKRDYPSTPFVLLTSLAEGADRLAAEVASDIDGFKLIAVLPRNEDDYEQDFGEESSRSAYRSMLAKSIRTIVCEGGKDRSKTDQYFAAGEFVAQNAQILFAIWDGISERETDDGQFEIPKGGTADIVRLAGAGVRSAAQLALPEPTIVEHVFALRRQSSSGFAEANAAKVGTIQEIIHEDNRAATGIIKESLTAIERFNRNAVRLDANVGWDLLGQRVDEVGDAVAIFEKADRLARGMQRQRFWAICVIAGLMLFSAFLQQVYSGPYMWLPWLAGHLLIAVVAYGIFRWFFRGSNRRDQNFLDWRGLAEGLRVHIFWAAGNLKVQVADFYFTEDRDELAWLRQAIRNVALLSAGDPADRHLPLAKPCWLEDQRDYFESNAVEAERRDRMLERLARILFGMGLAVTLVTFVAHYCGAEPHPLNLLVLGAGTCFLLAATVKAAGDQIGYSERRNRFRLMAQLFKLAVQKFDRHAAASDVEACRKILLEAGREALAENVSWLRLHRRRQFEISLG